MAGDESFNPTSLTLHAESEFADDEEALEALVNLKEMDVEDVFTNRDTQLDSDDGDGISIRFHTQDSINYLSLTTDSESNVHISLRLDEESIPQTESILDRIQDEIGDIDLRHIDTYRDSDTPFDEFDFPIVEDTEHNVRGIRIDQGNCQFIVQQWGDPSGILVSLRRDFDEGTRYRDIDGTGAIELERITEFLGEFS